MGAFIAGKLTKETLKKAVIIPVAFTIFGFVFAFWSFLINTLLFAVNLIHNLLNYTPPANTIIGYFYSVSSSIGIIDGFNMAFPVLSTALMTIIFVLLFEKTIKVAMAIFYIIKSILD
ncbi:MAG: hypothetical protein AB7E13_04780 [Arcobacteraceae bacterium]